MAITCRRKPGLGHAQAARIHARLQSSHDQCAPPREHARTQPDPLCWYGTRRRHPSCGSSAGRQAAIDPHQRVSNYRACASVAWSIEWRFGRRLSLFVEYKLTCAMIRGDLVGGGKVTTNLCTHQLQVGLAMHLRARAEPPRDYSAASSFGAGSVGVERSAVPTWSASMNTRRLR